MSVFENATTQNEIVYSYGDCDVFIHDVTEKLMKLFFRLRIVDLNR